MFKKKIKKLFKNPKRFFYDSKNPFINWFIRPNNSKQVPIAANSTPKPKNLEIDFFRNYYGYKSVLSNLNSSERAIVVAVYPLGVQSIDLSRRIELAKKESSILMPIWEYCLPSEDMDDFEFRMKKNPLLMAAVIRNLLMWSLANDVKVIAMGYGCNEMSKTLAARARNLGIFVICDLPFFLQNDDIVFDAYLDLSNPVFEKPSALTTRNVRMIAGIGGNDSLRLLVLPGRSFGLDESYIAERINEQIVAILDVCEPTDHIVIIAKRRKNGFINPRTSDLLKRKYRKTILFHDELINLEALISNAIDIRVPIGMFSKNLTSDSRFSLYDPYPKSECISQPLKFISGLSEIFTDNLNMMRAIPACDERESILKRIISGPGIGVVAVPDPISSSDITQGRQKYLEVLLNAKSRVYGGLNDAVQADVFIQWGAEPAESKERSENIRSFASAPRIYLEDGFIRSMGLWTNPNEPTCSIVIDTRSVYYDATKPSLLEALLSSSYELTEKEFFRAKGLIDAIVRNRISKYNYAPIVDLNLQTTGKKTLLLVDQKVGDLSIKYGEASDDTFRIMLDTALALGNEVEIIIKQHPCAINGDASEAHFTKASLGEIAQYENVHLIGFDVNPYSLIEAVDEVWVVSSGMGFEALMANKKVRCFGLPFYANWGLTQDAIQCSRRRRKRSVEEIFHFFYLMLSRYVDPDSGNSVSIEYLIEYFSTRVAKNSK